MQIVVIHIVEILLLVVHAIVIAIRQMKDAQENIRFLVGEGYCSFCGGCPGGLYCNVCHDQTRRRHWCDGDFPEYYGTEWGADCNNAKKVTRYSLSCGKNAGSRGFTRTVENYRCNTCGKTYQYKQGANSGTCGYCGGSHNIGASGSRPGGHNAVPRYLVCAYK